MAGFFYRKHLQGLTAGTMWEFIIDDTKTITIGDAVKLVSGFADLVTATGRVLGIVTGIVDKHGMPVDSNRADIDGTVSGSGETLTYLSASDNTTVAKVKVQVMVDPMILWYNDASTTVPQAEVGTYYDVVAGSDQIDQSTNHATAAQFQLIEIDPDADGDVSKGLFHITESALLI